MPKHNNLDIYPFDPSIDARDGVFGFDYNTGGKSKNFKMEHLRYFILQGLDPSNNGFVTTTGYTLVDNILTINAGWQWQINGMLFTNEEDIVFTLEYTAEGFVRIDSVYANSNNELLLTSGGESETIAVPPQIPINTLLAFSVNIFDTTIVAEEEPVIGNIYQQKQFDYLQTYTGTGTDVVIPLNTTGHSHIQLKGTMTSVAGLSFADLVANPVNAEYPHYGKRYLFFNDSGHDIVLKHLAATEDIFFTFKEETDLVFPNGEFLEFFNGSNVFINVFRSWQDISNKLDKVSTVDVEKVYIKNADGTQGMKPTSELLSEVLSNDETSYSAASLPLDDEDLILVNQGGTWKKAAKSELAGGGGNDIVMVKFFTNIVGNAFTVNTWYSFTYGNGKNFFESNFDTGTNYGTGSSPTGTPSVVVSSLNYLEGKKLDKFVWNTDYCDQFQARVCIKKFDVISGGLANGREILNEEIRILASGVNTQNALPSTKNKITFSTTDAVDTPISAQCSVYFLYYKHISAIGGGSGTTSCYFNFN